jgi:hypothetical protein
MAHTDANHWFWKINANAMGVISHRKYLKNHNPNFSNLVFKKNILELNPKLKIYRNYIRNEAKIQTQFAKQHSIRSLRIRKLTRLEDEK